MDSYYLKYKLLRQLQKILYRKNNGVYVVNEEWDNLIILDACRYDMLEEEYRKGKIQGKLEYRISRATCTPDFLKENFSGKDFKDIVYVTGNPYVDKFVKESFYKVISVWNFGWSERYRTVLPSKMYEYSLKAAKKYPNKRLIIHFMQPHYPFLSDMNFGDTGIKYLREGMMGKSDPRREITVWKMIEIQKIDMNRVIVAYKKNLEIALPYVKKILTVLRGKNIVSADHGNAIGEFFHPLIPIKVYGHPCGYRMKPLIRVPWLIYDNEISTEKEGAMIERELLRLKVMKMKKNL